MEELKCHLWQLENINDFVIKSRYYDYEGIFIGFYVPHLCKREFMKKFNKKLGTIKHVQFIGGPKRAHNGMKFFLKDQVFLFLASAFSQNMVDKGSSVEERLYKKDLTKQQI